MRKIKRILNFRVSEELISAIDQLGEKLYPTPARKDSKLTYDRTSTLCDIIEAGIQALSDGDIVLHNGSNGSNSIGLSEERVRQIVEEYSESQSKPDNLTESRVKEIVEECNNTHSSDMENITESRVREIVQEHSKGQSNVEKITKADVEKAIAKSTITMTNTISDTVGKMVNTAVEEKLSALSDSVSKLVDTAVEAKLSTLSNKASDAKDVGIKLSDSVRKTSAPPDKKKRIRTSSDKEASRNRAPGAKVGFPVGFPGGLTQADLGKRLGTTSTTVARTWKKGKIYFRAWSKKMDPDGISWEFRSTSDGVKYYFPWLS